jgi:hypothetical protein
MSLLTRRSFKQLLVLLLPLLKMRARELTLWPGEAPPFVLNTDWSGPS